MSFSWKTRRLGAARRHGVQPSLFLVLIGMALSARFGWAGEGVLALRSAASSCRDQSSNVYVDCGNGTVTDNRTGLVWLAKADCFRTVGSWEVMGIVASLSDVDEDFCAGSGLTAAQCDCGLSDGSLPGEWRLPSISEWQTMISNAIGQGGDPDCTASPPTITNDSGKGCWVSGPSIFSGVMPSAYWSSSPYPPNPEYTWAVDLGSGSIGIADDQYSSCYLWPVRGGQ